MIIPPIVFLLVLTVVWATDAQVSFNGVLLLTFGISAAGVGIWALMVMTGHTKPVDAIVDRALGLPSGTTAHEPDRDEISDSSQSSEA